MATRRQYRHAKAYFRRWGVVIAGPGGDAVIARLRRSPVPRWARRWQDKPYPPA
jgi:hypothetical protein